MNFISTDIPDILLIEAQIFKDDRGFFLESFQREKFREAGISEEFVQDNHSGSKQGVLRGLHYQIKQPQGKLVKILAGEIYDVCVDLRRSSPTYGKSVGVHLSADSKKQLWIPVGFAHGFYVLSEWAEILYKATDFYAPQWERTLLWNDPKLGIKWPLINGELPKLSNKDQLGCSFEEAELFE
jgi:dTDP-4-dehydrorhamnose 3,5-epimerase